MIRKTLKLFALAAVLLAPALPVSAEPLAKDVFGAQRVGNRGPAQAIGFYSKGCAAGNVRMPETGPTWQMMRLSRNRSWGQPELAAFLQQLSRTAVKAGWRGLYIGDMSQPMGGPMVTGHASHQVGLDADIWMLPPSRLNLSASEREKISSQSVVRGGVAPSALWSGSHHAILRAAASDPRVQRIFVDPVAKVMMCQNERGNRGYLRKIRPLNGHDYHFHVRLNCPAGSPSCQPQDAVPAGDGCEEAAQWIRNRVNPPPPAPANPNYRHPRSFRLSEMPRACQALVSR